MKATTVVTVLIAACLNPAMSAGGKKCAAPADSVPLCSVLSDAARYDGKDIVVSGIYRMVVHGSILTSSACPNATVNLRQARGYKANKTALAVIRSLTKHNQFQPVDVVLHGTFSVAHQGQCFGQTCSLYEVENQEFLCAQRPMSTSARR
jgi:hypothetical protein